MPVRLFCPPARPHLPPPRPRFITYPTRNWQEVRLLQGTPEEVLSNEELMQIVLPVLRADLLCVRPTYSAEEP